MQFGEGGLTFEIQGEGNVTDHEVLVIGMHAQTPYSIRALSTGAGGTLEGSTNFTTGALPAQIPPVTISVNDAAKRQPGWTLMNVQKGDGTNRVGRKHRESSCDLWIHPADAALPLRRSCD